jgi:uncharacterized protein DUF1579
MRFTLSILAAGLMLPALSADDKPAAKPLDPTLAKFATMIGGVWTNDNPQFRVEFRYDWALNKRVVRGVGIIDKGGKQEAAVEATFGYDPVKKSVYYLDLHGGETIYKGSARLDGDNVVLEFETLVGPPAKWRSVGKFPDKDTYEFQIFGEKDGQWTPVVKQTLKRKSS